MQGYASPEVILGGQRLVEVGGGQADKAFIHG
jgi:hypothetical protein